MSILVLAIKERKDQEPFCKLKLFGVRSQPKLVNVLNASVHITMILIKMTLIKITFIKTTHIKMNHENDSYQKENDPYQNQNDLPEWCTRLTYQNDLSK